TRGNNCWAAWGSPCSTADRMRVTSLIGDTDGEGCPGARITRRAVARFGRETTEECSSWPLAMPQLFSARRRFDQAEDSLPVLRHLHAAGEHAEVAGVARRADLPPLDGALDRAALLMRMCAVGEGAQRHQRSHLGEEPLHLLGDDVPQLELADA